ncbi:Citrate lyase beta chain [Lactococcus lactis subsp. lactis]|uniref:citrate (pro-3S)-lyase subunit beta n=1 Tax=Lactococcus lactis TaxID=1358 RepID=UPI000539FF9E|nr:citrate (pro-3S)-lyase subunit beta [Lactococcus lactis]KST92041.1 Citrate lyase beta chain [Lactococcus lactis subsp. lactis]
MVVKDRLRRTMMFVPGNNPSMLKDAGIYGADSIMFDLEDAVSITEKDAARVLVYQVIKAVDYENAELVVRVNGLDTPYWKNDVRAMVKAGIDVIRLPKVETAAMMNELEEAILEAEKEFGRKEGSTAVMAAIESALGVINVVEIAMSCPERMMGIALSGMDYTTDMKTHRYPDGQEMLFARNMVLHAARAAKISAFDTVFTDMNDIEGFMRETRLIHQLGFDGKSIINPRQVDWVNSVYEPTEKEIVKAQAVIMAIEEARRKGSGVISLNGQMVDRPVVLQAEQVMRLAKAANLVDEEGNYLEK